MKKRSRTNSFLNSCSTGDKTKIASILNDPNATVEINELNEKGQSALHLSIENDNYELGKLLVDFHIDINLIDKSALTPLQFACQRNNHRFFDSFQQNIFTSFNLEDEQRHETIERNIPRNKVGIERGRETTNSGFHTTENINELFPDHKIDIKNRSMDSRFSYDFDLPIEYSPFREDIINEKVEESDECINLYYNLLVLWDPRKGGVNRSVRTDKLPQYFQERDKKLHEMNLL